MELADPDLSVVLTDDDEIQSLNAEYRGEDRATDVLSFPMYESMGELRAVVGPVMLGDIVISLEYAAKMAASAEHRARIASALDQSDWTLEDEVHFLFIHGLLHLVGHDHAEPQEEARMKDEEARLWRER